MEFTYEHLKDYYNALTTTVTAECRLVTMMAGGVPSTEEGVRAFVIHQMRVPKADVEETVKQILSHELVGSRITPPEGELEETVDRGVNLIRRDTIGPWLGDWMIKACLKAAASRVGLFKTKIGTKGDMAEMGSITPVGISAGSNGTGSERRIYLRDSSGQKAAQTTLEFFRGKVSSLQGSNSIVNLAEVAPIGTRFDFKFQFAQGRITNDDIGRIFGCAMTIGLGSCKAFEMGKFAINRLVIQRVGEVSKAEMKGYKTGRSKLVKIAGED